jgi:hypothetical protein
MCTAETRRVMSIGITWGARGWGANYPPIFFSTSEDILATKLKRGK